MTDYDTNQLKNARHCVGHFCYLCFGEWVMKSFQS